MKLKKEKMDQMGRASLASLFYPPMRKGFLWLWLLTTHLSVNQKTSTEPKKRREKKIEGKGMKEKRILLGNTFQF